MLFGRIMTNGVWHNSTDHLKSVLTKLYEAGYDGDIAFHAQDMKKVDAFIRAAVSIWRRPDIVSIGWVGGSREKETRIKLKKLLSGLKGLPIKTVRIALSPVGESMAGFKSPWGDRWFKEDYCKGPGNALFVLPDGDVKPCCGYATDQVGLTIGNINRDSAAKIISMAGRNDFVRSVFMIGLTGIRKRLEKLSIQFPGKTENHCFFCHYLLTKVPKNILAKAICGVRLAVIGIALSALLASQSYAETVFLKKSKGYHDMPVKVVKKIALPKWYHEGLSIDGGSIWVANGNKGKIWVVDIESGKVTSDIEPPASFTEAIVKTTSGKYFLTDWEDKKLYEASLKDAKFVIEKTSFDFSPSHPAGLVYTNDSLLAIVWTRGLGTKFEIVKLNKDFGVAERIQVKEIQEPAHMAWDGKDLWITGWYNRRVYRVDSKSWEITASFRAPLNKVTGIAWDGSHLWLTGTYADLYQVELSTPGVEPL
ncbi:MAG: glutaminyl-peptide cyclotransferase [Candidatus Omnitrophica bacterium]|nr:glutaminyl-peptide cyclotransferase [Candidatus Omnitrophota bacterium]